MKNYDVLKYQRRKCGNFLYTNSKMDFNISLVLHYIPIATGTASKVSPWAFGFNQV